MTTQAARHLPQNEPLQRAEAALPSPWHLFHGGEIKDGHIAYSYYGDSSLPCILVLGGISAGRDVAHRTKEYASGWWSCQVGYGQSIDLNRYSVLGIDYLGGNGQSSRSELHANAQLCAIDSRDQARAIAVLAKQLSIQRFYSVIGSSYGGMVALALLEEFPSLVAQALVISSAHHSSPQSTGIRNIQREVVRLGLACGFADHALSLARSLAMVTYRSPQELAERFAAQTHIDQEGFHAPIVDYLQARGTAFADAFDPEAFCCLSQSIDLHRVAPEKFTRPLTCVAVAEDQLIPIELIERMAGLANANFIKINSIYGHDAFLKEQEAIGWIIRKHLSLSC